MQRLLFGTAGIPHSAKERSSAGGIARIRELGLDAMELEFVYGVKMTPAAASEVRKSMEENKVSLSVHAPYYINLNSADRQKLGLSRHNILQSCKIGALCGAESIVFHPGFYLEDSKEATFAHIKAALEKVLEEANGEKLPVVLCPETTGKPSQFGSLEELLELHSQIPGISLTVDFSHLHARGNGCLKTQADFNAVLEKMEKCDSALLKRMHIHASGINYSAKGERNHLNFQESGNTFNHLLLLNALKEFTCSGTVICESPSIEDDALLLQSAFKSL